jgi:hypothetical protein
MSCLEKDNDYDASYDVGVAVKEEFPAATLKLKKKRNRLGRSSAGVGHIRSESTPSNDDEEMNSPNGGLTHNAALADDYTSAASIGGTARSEKKSKKKRKRGKSSNSKADDGISNEGISRSHIHTGMTADFGSKKHKKSVLSPLHLKGMFINERTNLPVYQHSADIVHLISNNDVVLVVAETVSKTVSFRHYYHVESSQLLINPLPSSSLYYEKNENKNHRAAENQRRYLHTYTKADY